MTFCFFLSSVMFLLEVTSIEEEIDRRWLCFLRSSGYGTLYTLWVGVLAPFYLAEILIGTSFFLSYCLWNKVSEIKFCQSCCHESYILFLPCHTSMIPQIPLNNFMHMKRSLFLVTWSLTLASSPFFLNIL